MSTWRKGTGSAVEGAGKPLRRSPQKHIQPDVPFNMGAAIRQLREAQGILQGELAKRVGISQGHLSKIESNQRGYTDRLLRRVAHILGVKVYELDALAEGIRLEDKVTLSKAEARLLESFRELPADRQQMVNAVVDTLRPPPRLRGK